MKEIDGSGQGTNWVDTNSRRALLNSSGRASSLERCAVSLSRGEEVCIKVNDFSMEPTIVAGDVMVFMGTKMEKLRAGDIILFRRGGSAVARRIVKKTFEGDDIVFQVKQEGSSKLEASAKPQAVLGVLKLVERDGRKIKARSLNRGLIDSLTDYGSKSFTRKLLDMVASLVPLSMRGDKQFQERVAAKEKARGKLHGGWD